MEKYQNFANSVAASKAVIDTDVKEMRRQQFVLEFPALAADFNEIVDCNIERMLREDDTLDRVRLNYKKHKEMNETKGYAQQLTSELHVKAQ